jgi:hypothetical protein
MSTISQGRSVRMALSNRLPAIPYSRTWNILTRTGHLAVAGVVVGGHAFDVPAEAVRPMLYAVIGTGLVLTFLEAYPNLFWWHQGRGVMVLAKLALLCAVPFAWDYRLPILLGVVVLASVGSHMPARFRYHSILLGRMIKGSCGPGPGSSETLPSVESRDTSSSRV